ncbi:MAG: hypothetical protein IKE24_03720 [Clostridia bacterium]|nr:hypothetical protein [Clostridia bacterium]
MRNGTRSTISIPFDICEEKKIKYRESTFDILYLAFAIAAGILILRKANNRTSRLMGLAALILGCGDAFHLVPRVLNTFLDADMTAALGVGKLVTSVTMTVFYIPVAVAAGLLPILGILKLPKPVCYILIIVSFLRLYGDEKGA